MEDLYERETIALERAKMFLNSLSEKDSNYYEEFANVTKEYERLLRQAKLLMKCSDLNTTGLNSDKLELLDKVNIDELTRIYNRRFMDDNLKRYLNLLSRTGGYISLLMLDLDFFKKYNDTYGHTAGDTCLKKVANTLQNSINRAEDFAARYGGEEFLVVLLGAKREAAMAVAQRIIENVRALNIPHEQNTAANCVTVSIGVTSADIFNVHEPQIYIARADAALYHSKQTGRNKITYFKFEEEKE